MTNIDWTVENEIQLLYSMINHKPIGINKHFQMIAIHDKFTSSLNCELNVKEIWKKLETYYDLQALDESDKLPFPNTQEDFSLPQESFSSLIEDRVHNLDGEEEEPIKGRVKYSAKKDDLKEDGSLTPVLKREKGHKDVIDDDEEEKDTPRRMTKRGRETSLAKKSSPSPATIKRRR